MTETMMERAGTKTAPRAYVVKLGFAERSESAVAAASSIVIRTLEDFGHDVDKMQPQGPRRITLECDQFRMDLRHRRSPAPLRQYDGQACRSQLELHFSPTFPDHCDQEIIELLLAMLLRNLAYDMEDAVTVSWLGETTPISCEDFLSAFEEEPTEDGPMDEVAEDLAAYDARIEDESVAADLDHEIDALERALISAASEVSANKPAKLAPVEKTPAGRPTAAKAAQKTRARFAPVEATFGELSRHCDELVRSIEHDPSETESETKGISRSADLRTLGSFITTLLVALVSVPLAITVVAVNIIRTRDMRFGLQMSLVVALVLLLQTGSLVQAALQ